VACILWLGQSTTRCWRKPAEFAGGFLRAGYYSWCSSNSVKMLKAWMMCYMLVCISGVNSLCCSGQRVESLHGALFSLSVNAISFLRRRLRIYTAGLSACRRAVVTLIFCSL